MLLSHILSYGLYVQCKITFPVFSFCIDSCHVCNICPSIAQVTSGSAQAMPAEAVPAKKPYLKDVRTLCDGRCHHFKCNSFFGPRPPNKRVWSWFTRTSSTCLTCGFRRQPIPFRSFPSQIFAFRTKLHEVKVPVTVHLRSWTVRPSDLSLIHIWRCRRS